MQGNPLTNGSIGEITSMFQKIVWLPKYIASKPLEILDLNLTLEDDDTIMFAPADYQYLKTGKKALDGKQEYQMKNFRALN